jgi:predicted nucleic acid-binding protein
MSRDLPVQGDEFVGLGAVEPAAPGELVQALPFAGVPGDEGVDVHGAAKFSRRAAAQSAGAHNVDSELLVTRYVIGPEVAVRLARTELAISKHHQLVAPTLLRSQMLSLLYRAVRRGELAQRDADRQLNYVRALRIRLLGDRVLQKVAWQVADQLGWDDTLTAEYIALTQLQADAFITLDEQLADAVKDLVTVAPIESLN